MTNLGRVGSAIRVVGCSWLVLLACGGISERRGTDDNRGGSASGGSASTPKGGSPSNGHAGAPASAGTVTAVAGTGMATPTPPRDPEPCFNDSDCPVNSCGGDVCNWNKLHPQPSAEKAFVCNPAGTDAKGQDGWCTTDADCKCLAVGAKCLGAHCTFTRSSDANGG